MSGISNIGSSGEQQELAEYVDGLPNLSAAEALIVATITDAARPVFAALPRMRSRGSRAGSRSRCTCTSR